MTDDLKKLPPFDMDARIPKMKKTLYQVEVVVLGRVVRSPMAAINLSSIVAMATGFVATNYPQVSGFSVWNEDGTELLEVMDLFGFTSHVQPTVQKILGAQVLKGGIPVIQAGRDGVDLQKLMEEGRKAGRMVNTQKFDPAAPPATPPAVPPAIPKKEEAPKPPAADSGNPPTPPPAKPKEGEAPAA